MRAKSIQQEHLRLTGTCTRPRSKQRVNGSHAAKSCSLVALAAGLTLTGTSHSQSTTGDDETALEEIVVTARGFEENLQSVPLAISAFDEDAIEKRSILELEDVARFTPGFSFEDFSGGFATPIIRGQAQTSITALEQNVATFFDGLYVPRSWAIDIGTSNMQRIEIVKGPQSARYGQNAFAGAINYVPTKAALDVEEVTGNVDVTFGSDERQDIGGTLLLPVHENFVLGATYNLSEFDGSWENDHPFANANLGTSKSTNGNVGGWDNRSYSVSMAAQPLEGWQFDVAFYNYELENEARAARQFDHNVSTSVFNCGGLQFGNSLLICGDLPSAPESAIVDPRAFGVHSDTDTLRVGTSYDINETWGIRYLFGSIEGDTDIGTSTEPDPVNCGTLLGPPTFAPLCNFQTAPIGSIDYESHEFRVTFDADTWRGSLGYYLSEGEDDFTFISFNIAPLLDPTNFMPLVGQPAPSFIFDPGPFNVPLRDESTITEVSAVFAELHWTAPDGRSRVGLEARYNDSEVTLYDRRNERTLSEDFKIFTPRLSYERDVFEDSMLYGSIARGAKIGGFNGGAIAEENRSFDEELNLTYEIGLKNTLLDGRLVLNGSAYYTDWSDIQVNAADPDAVEPNSTNIVLNLGDAEVLGFEIDTLFQATDFLTLDATFSFAAAEYKSGTTDQRFVRPSFLGAPPCDDVVCNSDGDVSGNEVERTPRTQASLGAQWDGEYSTGTYFIRGDVSWQSAFYASTVNLAELPSRTLVNLRAGIALENGLAVSVWARNLFDEEYASNSFVVITPFNNQYGQFFGERQTFGITASWNF